MRAFRFGYIRREKEGTIFSNYRFKFICFSFPFSIVFSIVQIRDFKLSGVEEFVYLEIKKKKKKERKKREGRYTSTIHQSEKARRKEKKERKKRKRIAVDVSCSVSARRKP